MEGGYSICFNKWALDKSINGELGLLLIISSLCAEKGYCFASNDYFANLFNEHETTISRKIKKLSKKGYITVEYEKRGAEVKNRTIRLAKLLTDDYQNCYSTISKNAKDNNISINNTSKEIDNNKLLSIKKKSFVPPTLEEIEEYCKQRNNNVDPKAFYDYFTATNWIDSNGKKVNSWKGKILTWESYKNKEQHPKKETSEERVARITRELEEMHKREEEMKNERE